MLTKIKFVTNFHQKKRNATSRIGYQEISALVTTKMHIFIPRKAYILIPPKTFNRHYSYLKYIRNRQGLDSSSNAADLAYFLRRKNTFHIREVFIIQHGQQVLIGHGYGKDGEALFYLFKYKRTIGPFVVNTLTKTGRPFRSFINQT